MNKADCKNHFKDDIKRLYLQTFKLNLYVQNIRFLDDVRIYKELKQLSSQINELLNRMINN